MAVEASESTQTDQHGTLVERRNSSPEADSNHIDPTATSWSVISGRAIPLRTSRPVGQTPHASVLDRTSAMAAVGPFEQNPAHVEPRPPESRFEPLPLQAVKSFSSERRHEY